GGLHCKIVDTAGIRQTQELIEQEGIRRSKLEALEADLVLLVLDASRGLKAMDEELFKSVPLEKTIVVWNKTDIAPADPQVAGIEISALQKQGLLQLQKAMEQKL